MNDSMLAFSVEGGWRVVELVPPVHNTDNNLESREREVRGYI